MKTLLFWRNTVFDADSELEGAILITFGSFRRYPAGLCSSSTEEVAQWTVSARLPHRSFAQQSRTQCSVPIIRPFTHVFWYLVQLTFLRATIFCSRVFSWNIKILRHTDCHGHSEMVRLLRLTSFSTHIWLWFHDTFLLDIRPVAQSEAGYRDIRPLFRSISHIIGSPANA